MNLKMFVEINLIPVLLSLMHIISQSWHIWSLFGDYLDGVVSFFFILSSLLLYFFSHYTFYLFMFGYSIIQLYSFLNNYKNRQSSIILPFPSTSQIRLWVWHGVYNFALFICIISPLSSTSWMKFWHGEYNFAFFSK